MFETPVVMKRNSKFGSNYWYVYSPKIKRMVHLFSNLEYDHWILVEANPKIIRFCEQPKKIEWMVDNKLVSSIFDMWIERIDGSQCFIEIKYQSELNPQNPYSERSLRQTRLQKMWCEENNYEYLIQTEKEIRSNLILLGNFKEIVPFLHKGLSQNELDQHVLLQKIGSERITIQELKQECNHLSTSRLKQSLYALVLSGELGADLEDKELSLTTEVWKNGT
ncbi:TnsA endonuclease N-terminal domain-containing protein [Brevibacillus laterosporus]|uniref:TnsA endonuclease N-terminal domain-containing protein n=1 Tax=Brevibacillus laterosporus TaxID=1465 RepID=UPI003D2038D7